MEDIVLDKLLCYTEKEFHVFIDVTHTSPQFIGQPNFPKGFGDWRVLCMPAGLDEEKKMIRIRLPR